MIYPAINDLLEKVGSRYVLVNVVAKRARELVEGTPAFITTSEKKPVTVSTLEVYDGIVSYEPAKHLEDSAEEEADSLVDEGNLSLLEGEEFSFMEEGPSSLVGGEGSSFVEAKGPSTGEGEGLSLMEAKEAGEKPLPLERQEHSDQDQGENEESL